MCSKQSKQFMDSIKNRRSIRKYSDKDIEASLLNEIIAEAMQTPTMGNMQLYSVVVSRSKEIKEQLAPAHFNQPMVTGAPVVLTFCADFNRFTKWCEQRNADAGYDNFLSFMNAVQDTLLFAQTVTVLAEAAGLGTCYLGTTVYMPETISKVLNLPKLVVPVATITVGYPAEDAKKSDRLPVEAIMHNETYHDYSAEQIDQIYSAKEALEENKEFVRINKKENLAQVFTDCRYTRKDNEALSKTLWDFVKKQGF